jgi:hypothetical protein
MRGPAHLIAWGGLLTLSLLLGAKPARAHASFPEAKQILLPADRPEQIILATNFGLIFSEDSGATWLFSCEDALSAYAAPYLLGAPPSHRIFAVAGAALVYSDDDACGWQAARGTLSDVTTYGFAVDPSRSQRVFVVGVARAGARQGDHIYVSDDGGVSFGEPVFTAPERSAVLNVLVAPSQPSRLFAAMFAAPENHPILLRSDDSGEHWNVAADLVDSLGANPFELLAIDPLDENRLYARILGETAETLATSNDGGLSFVQSVAIPGKLSAFLQLASRTILVGGTAGTEAVGYRSNDDGHSFEPWPEAPHVHALAERNGKLYVAADNFADGYVIAESDDEGAHLRPLGGFNQVQGIKSCVADSCIESCTYYAGNGLWPETVCGATSTPPDAIDPPGAAAGAAPDAAAGANATGGTPHVPDEAEPSTATDGGAPGVAETLTQPGLRTSGGGCACKLSHGRRTHQWTGLLVAGAGLVARRKIRRKKP